MSARQLESLTAEIEKMDAVSPLNQTQEKRDQIEALQSDLVGKFDKLRSIVVPLNELEHLI